MRNENGAKAPKSNAERQAEYRRRKQEQKLVEVRGIYATPESAEKIKQFAKSLPG